MQKKQTHTNTITDQLQYHGSEWLRNSSWASGKMLKTSGWIVVNHSANSNHQKNTVPLLVQNCI